MVKVPVHIAVSSTVLVGVWDSLVLSYSTSVCVCVCVMSAVSIR